MAGVGGVGGGCRLTSGEDVDALAVGNVCSVVTLIVVFVDVDGVGDCVGRIQGVNVFVPV